MSRIMDPISQHNKYVGKNGLKTMDSMLLQLPILSVLGSSGRASEVQAGRDWAQTLGHN